MYNCSILIVEAYGRKREQICLTLCRPSDSDLSCLEHFPTNSTILPPGYVPNFRCFEGWNAAPTSPIPMSNSYQLCCHLFLLPQLGVFWLDYESLIHFFEVFYVNWSPDLFPKTFSIHRYRLRLQLHHLVPSFSSNQTHPTAHHPNPTAFASIKSTYVSPPPPPGAPQVLPEARIASICMYLSLSAMFSQWAAQTGPRKDNYNISDNPQFLLDVQAGSQQSGSLWVLLTRHITDKVLVPTALICCSYLSSFPLPFLFDNYLHTSFHPFSEEELLKLIKLSRSGALVVS